jgi:hypothetical protein
MRLVDVVNFNGDASCLSTAHWLKILSGGSTSEFFQWLHMYVDTGSQVVLGFPGATASDIAVHNPEAISLIRAHPDLFQLILRPYCHDLALLRTEAGFLLNLETGERTLRRLFGQIANFYLPPEFMLTSQQVSVLHQRRLSTFVFGDRLDAHVSRAIPNRPFEVAGVRGARIPAIPFDSVLTRAYLATIQRLDTSIWSDAESSITNATAYLWRDGESVFLLPDSLSRERLWLNSTSPESRILLSRKNLRSCESQATCSYPVPSFSAWMREMKMYWYLQRIHEIELELESLDDFQKAVWLQTINSDILSSVEKFPPCVQLLSVEMPQLWKEHEISRHSRALEGEDYLSLLGTADDSSRAYLENSPHPHMVRLRGRLRFLLDL